MEDTILVLINYDPYTEQLAQEALELRYTQQAQRDLEDLLYIQE